jgi:transcriptional regulator with XRE-family HTH domain
MEPSLFGQWVKRRLGELGISQRKFGAAVGMSHSNLNKILNGSHEDPPTPLGDDCARWADALKIPDDQRQRFRMMAAVAHIPGPTGVEFEALVDEHLALKAQVLEMRSFYDRRVAEAPAPDDGSPPGAQP